MSSAGIIAAAAVTGAVAGGIVAFGLGRDKAAVSATIVVSPGTAQCAARTFPATIIVSKKDIVHWTVVGDFTGNCSEVNPENIELQIVGNCGTTNKATVTPDIFQDENPYPLRGRKIRRNLKSNQPVCYAYRVQHANLTLEDPEIEIVQF